MDLNTEVARQIKGIRQDRTHGASWLSKQAIGVLNLAATKSEAGNTADFLEELKAVAGELLDARPSMAPITNCVSRFIYEVSQESNLEKDVVLLKSFACSQSNELIKDSEEAFRKTTKQGAELIDNGDELMTCSYSSTICQALRTARIQGKEFHVIVAESRFGGKVYGELAAEQLKEYGILAEIVPDDAIEHYISKVNKVLVGVDSISADGSLINGTPTGAVSLAAKESNIPLYSLCETTKFDIRSWFRKPIELEEGFDRIPPDSITGIIIEEGLIKPGDVGNRIEKMEWIQSIAGAGSNNLLP